MADKLYQRILDIEIDPAGESILIQLDRGTHAMETLKLPADNCQKFMRLLRAAMQHAKGLGPIPAPEEPAYEATDYDVLPDESLQHVVLALHTDLYGEQRFALTADTASTISDELRKHADMIESG